MVTGLALSHRLATSRARPRPIPSLAAAEQLFARKYAGRDESAPDGRHARLRLTPDKLVSWDFRKLARPAR